MPMLCVWDTLFVAPSTKAHDRRWKFTEKFIKYPRIMNSIHLFSDYAKAETANRIGVMCDGFFYQLAGPGKLVWDCTLIG